MPEEKHKVLTVDEFLHMSPEEQAQRLAADQASWLGKYSGAGFVTPAPRTPIKIVAQQPSFDEITSCDGWKQPPNQSERETMKNDQGWK